jgi:hypothetical protein
MAISAQPPENVKSVGANASLLAGGSLAWMPSRRISRRRMPQGVTRGSKLCCNVTQFGRCCGHNRTFKVAGSHRGDLSLPFDISIFILSVFHVALTRIERSDDFSPSSAMSVLLPVPFIPLNAMCPRQKVPSWESGQMFGQSSRWVSGW